MASKSDEMVALLDSIAERVEECRAAIQTAAEGDPDALTALGAEVDEMADDMARLKAAVSTPAF